MAMSAIHKIKHKGCDQDANKARGKAECFIGIDRGSTLSVLFYI